MEGYYDVRRAAWSLRESAVLLRVVNTEASNRLATRCEREAATMERKIGFTGGRADQAVFATKISAGEHWQHAREAIAS